MFYRGIFEEMKVDNNLDIQEINFYEGYYASFYEQLLKKSNYDIDFYASQAILAGEKILELACGTGRVGIPLAKAGFDVTGVDISQDMLAIYEEKLCKEARRVKNKVNLVHGDITNILLEEQYDLIIFPATTICLFDDEKIQKIFKFVKDHLSEKGRFIFDRAVVNNSCFLGDSGLPFMTKWWDENTYNVVWTQEFLFSELNEVVVNIYGERINGMQTTRNIGYTRKRIITKNIVEENIRSSGLKLLRTVDYGIGSQHEIEFFILSK